MKRVNSLNCDADREGKVARRLAYLATHPIQNQAPLLRAMSEKLHTTYTHAFFQSDLSVKGYFDPAFGRHIQWDIPLTEGYSHEFLPTLLKGSAVSTWLPISLGLRRRLQLGRFDYLWVHGYGRPYNIAAILTAIHLGIRVLVRDDTHQSRIARGPVKEAIKRAIFSKVVRNGGGFLAIGSLNADYYRQLGVPDDRIFLMPYAVDNDFFASDTQNSVQNDAEFRSSLGIPNRCPVILFCGKLQGLKRPLDLISAYKLMIAQMPEDEHPALLFAGDGELREQLEAQAQGLPLARLLGFVNQGALPRYLALADIFVLPSAIESWGLAVNEAMSASCAVVVSDRVGCGPDLVQQGKNGYIYPVGDINALAGSLLRCVEDRQRLRDMGAYSRQLISGVSFDRNIADLESAFHQLEKTYHV